MITTCHSEYGKLKSVFLKHSRAAFVDDKHLNDKWEELNYLSKPHFVNASIEYAAFERFLNDSGAALSYFPPDDTVNMDSIYCRDASIATDAGMILCRMGKDGRKNEPDAQHKAYADQGVKVLGSINTPGTLEGGDVAWLDQKTLAVGITYRTNMEGIEQLKSFVNPQGVEVIVVPLPHYKGPSDVFHLMSILSPVDDNLAVVYSPLMPIVFRKQLLERGFQLVEVPDHEFETMGCNVLAVAPRKCVMVKGNPVTKNRLEQSGCSVWEYDGQEISVKGGGGPTCLTRPVLRQL